MMIKMLKNYKSNKFYYKFPLAKFAPPRGKSGHGPHQPFHQCQPRSHGGWYQTFQKMYYIKMCLKCVLGPK